MIGEHCRSLAIDVVEIFILHPSVINSNAVRAMLSLESIPCEFIEVGLAVHQLEIFDLKVSRTKMGIK